MSDCTLTFLPYDRRYKHTKCAALLRRMVTRVRLYRTTDDGYIQVHSVKAYPVLKVYGRLRFVCMVCGRRLM